MKAKKKQNFIFNLLIQFLKTVQMSKSDINCVRVADYRNNTKLQTESHWPSSLPPSHFLTAVVVTVVVADLYKNAH